MDHWLGADSVVATQSGAAQAAVAARLAGRCATGTAGAAAAATFLILGTGVPVLAAIGTRRRGAGAEAVDTALIGAALGLTVAGAARRRATGRAFTFAAATFLVFPTSVAVGFALRLIRAAFRRAIDGATLGADRADTAAAAALLARFHAAAAGAASSAARTATTAVIAAEAAGVAAAVFAVDLAATFAGPAVLVAGAAAAAARRGAATTETYQARTAAILAAATGGAGAAATVAAAVCSGGATAAAAANGAVVAATAAAGNPVGTVGQSFKGWTDKVPNIGGQDFGSGVDKLGTVVVLGRSGRNAAGACRQQEAYYEPQWQQEGPAFHDAHLRENSRACLFNIRCFVKINGIFVIIISCFGETGNKIRA